MILIEINNDRLLYLNNLETLFSNYFLLQAKYFIRYNDFLEILLFQCSIELKIIHLILFA